MFSPLKIEEKIALKKTLGGLSGSPAEMNNLDAIRDLCIFLVLKCPSVEVAACNCQNILSCYIEF